MSAIVILNAVKNLIAVLPAIEVEPTSPESDTIRFLEGLGMTEPSTH